jgi:threonine dehydrogenase-like Zn-dependent dehydrogenase
LWEGYQGPEGQFLKTTDRGVKYPLTPGHEIAGVIDSLGEQTEGFPQLGQQNKSDIFMTPQIFFRLSSF